MAQEENSEVDTGIMTIIHGADIALQKSVDIKNVLFLNFLES